MTEENFTQFLKKNLPIADIAGISLKSYSESQAQTQVALSPMSQNPFQSMFWAVQGMAAELSTGVLCMNKIENSKKHISMLVVKQEAEFMKKAVGNIIFTCKDGHKIEGIIKKAVESKEGEILLVTSEGKDENGDIVSIFRFTWSFKIKR